MPYTGADYAAAASIKVDWATADHMRRAMFDALKQWKELPANERTAAKGRELWVKAPLADDILQKAGTAQIVGEYYRCITSNISDKDMLDCMNSISDKDLKGINEGLNKGGLQGGYAMLRAATHFSEAGKKYLHIETLTDSYQAFLKENQKELGKIVMPMPKPFTRAEISALENDQSLFNFLDGVDNALSYVNLGSKGVSQKMVDFTQEREEKLNDVLKNVSDLQSGNLPKINKALAHLKEEFGWKTDIKSIKTPQQASLVADALAHTVMDMRVEATAEARADGFQALQSAFEKSVTATARLPAEKKAAFNVDHNDISVQPGAKIQKTQVTSLG